MAIITLLPPPAQHTPNGVAVSLALATGVNGAKAKDVDSDQQVSGQVAATPVSASVFGWYYKAWATLIGSGAYAYLFGASASMARLTLALRNTPSANGTIVVWGTNDVGVSWFILASAPIYAGQVPGLLLNYTIWGNVEWVTPVLYDGDASVLATIIWNYTT